LKPIIDEFGFSKDIRTLVVGCGNAEFSENLYDDGFKDITNIDLSSQVISFMKSRVKEKGELVCNYLNNN
jgi:2-polyprenyl-3-methyl-5-hydroxy-6-metoxy-1,4-benzoquinol methylase